MKKDRLITIVSIGFGISLFLGLFATQINAQKESNPTRESFYGKVNAGRYTNTFFGFDFVIPSEYTVLETKQAEFYSDAGIEAMKSKNEAASKRVDDIVSKQETLLAIAQKAIGLPENSTVEFVVTKQTAGATAKMSLARSVALMTSSLNCKFIDSMEREFGGKKLSGALLQLEIGSAKINQEFFAVNRNGYLLLIGVGYSTNDGRDKMLAMLKSLKFSN